jgi:mRNA interferase RelE/StbE
MFKILYDARVKDDVSRFPASVRERIRKAIEEKLSESPEIFGKPLRNSLAGFRSLRKGGNRVVFLIQKNEILILLIAHRKDVYNRVLGRRD